MGMARNIRTVTEMKIRAAGLLDEINQAKRPFIITQDGRPRAVILDVDSYEELRAALGILKLAAQGEEDIRAGRWTSQDEVFRRLGERLKSARTHGRKKT